MILQCDQCNTKFRLDDSKLKPGGVKVRCSKCRHVFLAGAEQKHEESEFDAILSGLGAPAPARTPEAAPSAAQQQPSGAELAALEVGTEPSQPQQKAALAADLDFGGFDFAPEEPGEPQPQETGKGFEPEGQQEPDFGLGEINFETGTVAGSEPEQTAGGEFGDFEFNEEPVAPAKEAPAVDNLDFGDLSFADESAPKDEKAAPAVADTLDFGEFSFDEETTLAKEEKAAPAAADTMDFGEFSFDEETSIIREEKQAPAAADALDFGEFSFEEESLTPEVEKPASAAAANLDFGEFSFEEESSTPTEEKPASAAAATLDFGEFSFEEESSTSKEEQAAPAAAVTHDFGEFSFEEEPPRTEEVPLADVSDDFASFSLSGQEQKKEVPPVSGPDEEFSFGEFSFPEEPEPEPVPKEETVPPPAAVTAGVAAAAGLSAATGRPEAAATPVAPTAGLRQKGPQSSLDFTFGDQPFATPVPEEVPEEEELPPLSIVSRRRGRSALTISIVAISVIVVLALSAAGLYLLQSGPAALEKLDKMGIGFVAQWFGMQSPEEGRITIRNPLAAFHQNQEAGELFVVTGEAVNSFRKARASVQVKVSLFDKSGKVLLQKTAYCGNRLSNEQLSTLPMEKIESIMNNQFGDSLSNLGVKPGQPIGFVVAIANVPKEAADFGVEVVGSTVAAGQ